MESPFLELLIRVVFFVEFISFLLARFLGIDIAISSVEYYHPLSIRKLRRILPMETRDDFTQLKLHLTDPVQHDYRVIRSIPNTTNIAPPAATCGPRRRLGSPPRLTAYQSARSSGGW